MDNDPNTRELYLDANATSPVLPAALAAASAAMDGCFGNPSSSHAAGLRARRILDATRARARRVLGAGEGRVLFTSGATEGIQTAVLSALCALRERRAAGEPCGDLLLYGATEHKAVSESLAHWNRLLGTRLTLRALAVGPDGRHDLDMLRELAPRAAMVCTMAANNETGVISDLDGIAGVLRDHAPHACWMVDCVQALGKLPLGLAHTRIDYAPFSGHKLYAPKGIGMLYVRAGAPYTPLMIGGGQEAGQRSGTENMAGIAALGAVLAALEEGATFRGHAEMSAMRDRLAGALRDAFPAIVFNTPFEHALPTTLNFAVPGMPSKELLDLFDAAGVRVSAGSACSAAKAAPSYVLEAMGLPLWRSSGAVRLSFGPLADEAFIDAACARIRRCGEAAGGSALTPSALSGRMDGVLQLSSEGRHGWIAFDLASNACVIIDPPAGLAHRIAAMVHARGLQVKAVLATRREEEPARAALRLALGHALARAAGDHDAFGWPCDGFEAVLADGGRAPCIALGGQVLARVADEGSARAAYLLGSASGARLPLDAVRMVFGGDRDAQASPQAAPAAPAPARLAHGGAVLCHGADLEGGAWSLLSAAQHVPAAGAAAAAAAAQLQPDALAAFLAAHPDALLVDVREPAEVAAANTAANTAAAADTAAATAADTEAAGAAIRHGRAVLEVPLSRLADHLDELLAAPRRPLLFVCRSGNRSARAALCLRRAGHAQAWTLAGGAALADGPIS